MSQTFSSTGPSREGDQFHYAWAAIQCLKLLDDSNDLCAVGIEGVSEQDNELFEGDNVDVIDVSEYYGSPNPEHARLIRYIQAKHTTVGVSGHWTLSGLDSMWKGFGYQFRKFKSKGLIDRDTLQIEFVLVSNKRVGNQIRNLVEAILTDDGTANQSDLESLSSKTKLCGDDLYWFVSMLRLQDNEENVFQQRNKVIEATGTFLPERDSDAGRALIELVTMRATTQKGDNTAIVKQHVLSALAIADEELFPSPNQIEQSDDWVAHHQHRHIVHQILETPKPVIVHAQSGVGKSVFAASIGEHLPPGSHCVVYDCFGNGGYRNDHERRDQAQAACVQIANELAASGLCRPLIPRLHVPAEKYLKALLTRLESALQSLRAQSPQAVLIVVIDAADNAQIAAEEFGDGLSFVRGLLRLPTPDGVHVVATSRSHRAEMLDAPMETMCIELEGFNRDETRAHIDLRFPVVDERDVESLHELSSGNPRVQAFALERAENLADALGFLSGGPIAVEDVLNSILDESFARTIEQQGTQNKLQLIKVCQGLAALPPRVPVAALAVLGACPEETVVGVLADFGHALLIQADHIQFRDEPVESWFKQKFKLNGTDYLQFMNELRPQASHSSYVAMTLPRLLLQAGEYDELIELAHGTAELPAGSELDRARITLHRVHYALKACLRTRREVDAAKLAFKASKLESQQTRLVSLFAKNADLLAVTVSSEEAEGIIVHGDLGESDTGVHYASQSVLLAAFDELVPKARSRLHAALSGLDGWARLSNELRQEIDVFDEDKAEFAFACLNLDGPRACAAHLSAWQPKSALFVPCQILARRLIDAGRVAELNDFVSQRFNSLYVILAVAGELYDAGLGLPECVLRRTLQILCHDAVSLDVPQTHNSDAPGFLRALCIVVEDGWACELLPRHRLSALIKKYAPRIGGRNLSEPWLGGRKQTIRSLALSAKLDDAELDIHDLMPPDLKKQADARKEHVPDTVRSFSDGLGPILRWTNLTLDLRLGLKAQSEIAQAVQAEFKRSTRTGSGYGRDGYMLRSQAVAVASEAMCLLEYPDASILEAFEAWALEPSNPVAFPTLIMCTRRFVHQPHLRSKAFRFAECADGLIASDLSTHPESCADFYIELARAVWPLGREDVLPYWEKATEIMASVSQENLSRWDALIEFAKHDDAADLSPELAYRLARFAEYTYRIDEGDHFSVSEAVTKVSALCPSSAVAIASRWRDRDFARHERFMPDLVSDLLERHLIDPLLAFTFLAFDGEWDLRQLVTAALSAHPDRRPVLAELLDYYICRKNSKLDLRRDVIEELRVLIPDAEAALQTAEYLSDRLDERHSPAPSYRAALEETPDDEPPDWDLLFKNCPPWGDPAIVEYAQEVTGHKTGINYQVFWTQLFERVPFDQQMRLLQSLEASGSLSVHNLRAIMEVIPDGWLSRPAVRSQAANLIKSKCRSRFAEVQIGKYYDALPFDSFERRFGVSKRDICGIVLEEYGESTSLYSAEDCYKVAHLIAMRLDRSQALGVLVFGLDLFEPELADEHGDGPWRAELDPACTVDQAVCGYLSAGLGHPIVAQRWQAAHAVCSAAKLGLNSVIEQVRDYSASLPAVFTDARFVFYQRSALQWMLISFWRMSAQCPAIVKPHTEWIAQHCSPDSDHVVMREVAARTLLNLHKNGVWTGSSDELERLRSINVSKLATVESTRYEELQTERRFNPAQERRFHFNMDISAYWLPRIARVFAKTVAEMEASLETIMLDEWGAERDGEWLKDTRVKAGLFNHGGVHHSHGSYPRVENLDFFYTYHSLMEHAGRLLRQEPVHIDPNDREDEFCDWLSGHLLSRSDGFWLADRRDAIPCWEIDWQSEPADDTWRYSVARSTIDECLRTDPGWINLWGEWSSFDQQREQRVAIRSGLVCPDKSDALMRALQAMDDESTFLIPHFYGEPELNHHGFQLREWIGVNEHLEKGIDEFDMWSGEIRYPVPAPLSAIIDDLGLEGDTFERHWWSKADPQIEVVMKTHSWAIGGDSEYSRIRDKGYRTCVTLDFIKTITTACQADMIVSVSVSRHLRDSGGRRTPKDEIEYLKSYERQYLFRHDGRISTLR